MSEVAILELRARAQRLAPAARRRSAPETVLRDVCGLQAQVLSAAALGLRARSSGLRTRDVTVALNEDRSIVRTWLMRGTLHLVAADDLRWMLGVLGPVFAAGNQARHAELGLDAELKHRGVTAIRRILARSGPLTRYEIVDRLRSHGINLDPRTQAPIHLIAHAAFQGVLCLGPERDRDEPTYVLIDDWIDAKQEKSPKNPLGEFARRYFAAYGPASVDDLVGWSGLPVASARSALAAARASLSEVTIGARPAFIVKSRAVQLRDRAPSKPAIRLLPAFDTYLLGYRSRDLAVPVTLQRRLQRGGGWLHPAVVVNGRAVAAWSLKGMSQRGHVLVEPVEALPANVSDLIAEEVADIGRFLDMDLRVDVQGYVLSNSRS
ncbi:MAG TPA: winged helix DNA-binding domain-containing protein [Candidatus Acidoferrum sp.]|nr:winged helix DNA-binding domain-containing protein [Candidatus Acidoferrum sp.]